MAALETCETRTVAQQLAKMPSGEPISIDFLNKILGGRGPPVRSYEVDEKSVIQGRHSVTFRLFVDRGRGTMFRHSDGVREGDSGGIGGECGCVSSCDSEDTTNGIWCNHCNERFDRRGLANNEGKTDRCPTSVFVKRMVCTELPSRSLAKWRSSISSYRAEISFMKNLAESKPLQGIAPHAYWVYLYDRLGYADDESVPAPARLPQQAPQVGENRKECGVDMEQTAIDDLRKSCFMMITEDLGVEPANLNCHMLQDVSSEDDANLSGSVDKNVTATKGLQGWEQVGAMDMTRAKLALLAAARLHASFWRSQRPGNPEGSNPRNTKTRSKHRSLGKEDDAADGSTEATSTVGSTVPCSEKKIEHRGGDKCSRYAPGIHKQGAFTSLEKRDPADLPGMEEEYNKMLTRFRSLLPAEWFDDHQQQKDRHSPGQVALARRLAARAVDLDAAAHGIRGVPTNSGRGGAGEAGDKGREARGRTLVHGDLKTWNVFFAQCTSAVGGVEAGRDGDSVKFIDWQWCGDGLAAGDVAYIMCTSFDQEALASDQELLRFYHTELSRRIERFHPSSPEYTFEEFVEDFRVAFLDYVRCVVGTLWKGLTPEKMEKNRISGPGMSLINRSMHHMQWIITKATQLLDELDRVEAGKS